MSLHHDLSGHCPKCLEIFDRYPGFYQPLKGWFINLQLKNPDMHISCAGRGKLDQESVFTAGKSKAHWLESAHNWNMAMDVFFQLGSSAAWPIDKFKEVVEANLPPDFTWYGKEGSAFKELPHVEVARWKTLKLKPVE